MPGISVHPELCQGYGCCVVIAPEVFDIDDVTGKVKLLEADPPAELRDAIAEAVRDCPVHAITVAEA